MNYGIIARTLGYVMMVEGSFLSLSAVASLLTGASDVGSFYPPILLCVLGGYPLTRIKSKSDRFFVKEGLMIAGLSWLVMVVIGALPFYIGGHIPSFVDCLFESASGFSTTGASILTDVEALPRGLLFWRSLTHWLGGMGVLVLMMALVPLSGGSSLLLMRAESTGLDPGKVVPRMRETARRLYTVYIALSAIVLVALLLCGMTFYDAALTMFGTVGTGGFTHTNAGIGGYNNLPAEMVVGVFMFVCSLNFGIYYQMFTCQRLAFFKNTEAMVYTAMVGAVVLMMAFNVLPIYGNLPTAFHQAAFQASSLVSTTGYATANFDLWPDLSRALLMLLMFMGGCAGSTAGGFKAIRVMVIYKAVRREINHILHPRRVQGVTVDDRMLSEEMVRSVLLYFALYVALLVGSFLLVLMIDGFDLLTSFSSALTCISNVGPVFGLGNFAMFSGYSKLVLTFTMMAGRLELYPFLLLFSPAMYKKG